MDFYIKVEMKDRWVPYFLAMLEKMQYLGGIGASRVVGIMADGDGDFKPKFTVHNVELSKTPEPRKRRQDGITCDFYYDAG